MKKLFIVCLALSFYIPISAQAQKEIISSSQCDEFKNKALSWTLYGIALSGNDKQIISIDDGTLILHYLFDQSFNQVSAYSYKKSDLTVKYKPAKKDLRSAFFSNMRSKYAIPRISPFLFNKQKYVLN